MVDLLVVSLAELDRINRSESGLLQDIFRDYEWSRLSITTPNKLKEALRNDSNVNYANIQLVFDTALFNQQVHGRI